MGGGSTNILEILWLLGGASADNVEPRGGTSRGPSFCK